jgi:predicted PurR-regulated permease PerM
MTKAKPVRTTTLSSKALLSDPDIALDIDQGVSTLNDGRTGSRALYGLLLFVILTLLYFARDLVLPVVVALILSLVFMPTVRAMKKIFIPAPLGAAIIVLGLFAVFLGGAYRLAEPASDWLQRTPEGLQEIDVKLRRITGSVHQVATATAKVEEITKDMSSSDDDSDSVIKEKPQEVVVQTPPLAGVVFTYAREFVVTAISTLVLLYFLLASGDMFLRKTIAATPRLADKMQAIDIAQQVEAEVSTYLLTVTMINICLGCLVTLLMYLLGVQNPLLWGVMTAVFNFIPYFGDIASISILTIVGLLTFDELWRSLLVPGVFYVLTAAEGYLITPLIVGKRMNLNPVVIVLSVLFWGWMWGIPGALLAVPILVVLKTLCDRVKSLQVFGEFLGA